MNRNLIKKLALKINRIAKERKSDKQENSVDDIVYSEIAFTAAQILSECDKEADMFKEKVLSNTLKL